MSSEVKRYAGLDGREYVSLDDYTALKAENARLVREAKNDAIAYKAVLERQDELRAERDAARAQLAAIQGGTGEDVAVLATVSMGGVECGIGGAELGDIDIQPDMKALCALQQSLVTGEDDAYVELIDKAQHQRITAAMAAERDQFRELAKANGTALGDSLRDRDAHRQQESSPCQK